MFEVGHSLIVASGTIGASTADPPANFFKPPQTRTAILVDPRTKTASNRTPKTAVSTLDAMRWPPVSGGKIGWPKGVPRIAKLDDEPRKTGSRAANRSLSPKLTLISIPRVFAEYSVGRSVIRDADHSRR